MQVGNLVEDSVMDAVRMNDSITKVLGMPLAEFQRLQDEAQPWKKLGYTESTWKAIQQASDSFDAIGMPKSATRYLEEQALQPWKMVGCSETAWKGMQADAEHFKDTVAGSVSGATAMMQRLQEEARQPWKMAGYSEAAWKAMHDETEQWKRLAGGISTTTGLQDALNKLDSPALAGVTSALKAHQKQLTSFGYSDAAVKQAQRIKDIALGNLSGCTTMRDAFENLNGLNAPAATSAAALYAGLKDTLDRSTIDKYLGGKETMRDLIEQATGVKKHREHLEAMAGGASALKSMEDRLEELKQQALTPSKAIEVISLPPPLEIHAPVFDNRPYLEQRDREVEQLDLTRRQVALLEENNAGLKAERDELRIERDKARLERDEAKRDEKRLDARNFRWVVYGALLSAAPNSAPIWNFLFGLF